jgi:hypothetical protein
MIGLARTGQRAPANGLVTKAPKNTNLRFA